MKIWDTAANAATKNNVVPEGVEAIVAVEDAGWCSVRCVPSLRYNEKSWSTILIHDLEKSIKFGAILIIAAYIAIE